jgi:hypothetical protein
MVRNQKCYFCVEICPMQKITILFLVITMAFACKQKDNAGTSYTVNAPDGMEEITGVADTVADSTAKSTKITAVSDKKTTIYFPKDSYNFGQITEGEVVTHIFSFTNSGDEPLYIRSARGSCGCTVPEHSKKPISPGQKGEIKVSFDSNGREGPNTKGIFIESNTEPELTILKISAEVMPKEKKKVQPTKEERQKIEDQEKNQM